MELFVCEVIDGVPLGLWKFDSEAAAHNLMIRLAKENGVDVNEQVIEMLSDDFCIEYGGEHCGVYLLGLN